jgi:hypothetical protein
LVSGHIFGVSHFEPGKVLHILALTTNHPQGINLASFVVEPAGIKLVNVRDGQTVLNANI